MHTFFESCLSRTFKQVRLILRKATIATACLLITSPATLPQTATVDCTPASFNNHVRVVSSFRSLEVFINTLVHAQSQAILEVETGIAMSNADGAFFGPLGLLRKITDKAQTEINNAVIAARRLNLDEATASRMSEIAENADEIVAVGFEMNGVLEAGQIVEATRMLMERTLPAHKNALGGVHTVISLQVRRASTDALLCR